jgi:hypothetical protein
LYARHKLHALTAGRFSPSSFSQSKSGDLFVRYIEHFGLTDELRRLSPNSVTCRPLPAAYNERPTS